MNLPQTVQTAPVAMAARAPDPPSGAPSRRVQAGPVAATRVERSWPRAAGSDRHSRTVLPDSALAALLARDRPDSLVWMGPDPAQTGPALSTR